ncbi:unnamed protein product [Macrosiphum euphorbiae]|uniref:Uncharacterized protein n=1 Tax=Macrosiphum euphorbiae TaxID=13131 RepID=A0AAV0XYP8_9HEMI|nr:unnamed protein product [Macrosiphum euphorbiae]
MTSKIEETFTRAALYEICSNSKVLRHINLKNTSLTDLRELINMHQALRLRHIPILLAKLATKFAIDVIVKQYPVCRTYVSPDNIQVRVENDEMACIEASIDSKSRKPNLHFIVLKNIAVSAFGLSLNE